MSSDDCHYGTLARVHGVDNSDSATTTVARSCVDLLLALSNTHLFVLARRSKNPPKSCICMSPRDLTASSSAQQQLASSFQCPHVESCDVYESCVAIAYGSIVLVQLTFRTVLATSNPNSSASVAERTKDCVVVLEGEKELRLEFEHNLARGAFLDALMAVSMPHATLDVDYVDLTSIPGDSKRRNSPLDLLDTSAEISRPQTSFAFCRQALRVAIQGRIQVALQLSSEFSLNDPHCHFLLGTSMELSLSLDEPDLHALTWLVSGFINLQRARLGESREYPKLAQKQLRHAIDLARENSLQWLLALALACCADLHLVCTQQKSTTKTMLVEAARLLPPNALTSADKMQLHGKIRDLGMSSSPAQLDTTNTSKDTAFDLWKALSTALSGSSTTSNGVAPCQRQCTLLHAVRKGGTGRSRFCFVEMASPSGALTAIPLQRLRVYFIESDTFEALRDEVTQRCAAIPPNAGDRQHTVEIQAFYSSAETSKLPIPWPTHLSEVDFQDGHVLHAALKPLKQANSYDTPHAATSTSAGVPAASPSVLVRCSQCGEQVPLGDVEQHSEIARCSAEYTPTYQRFVLKKKTYAQQFSHIYVSRLQQLREAVARQVEEDVTRTGESVAVLPKVIDLKADGRECVLIGTLLKQLGGKPDIFEALTDEGGIAPIERAQKPLATPSDELLLEDESGRVELVGGVDVARMVTGVVLGVRGRVPAGGGGGQFHVEHMYMPSFPPQHALPERRESAYVALVSGLGIGRNSTAQPLRNHLLVDYLAGRLGDTDEKQFVARIVRTVVAGNSMEVMESAAVQAPSNTRKSAEELTLEAAPLKNADELLSSLAAAMCVDVMPGASDPSNYTLPQQSFHPCLFPRSSHFQSFRCVTNPYEAQLDGVQLFGHAGQPLRSMLQCTLPQDDTPHATDADGDASMAADAGDAERERERALDYLEQSLAWRHAAPTAPDLLACFPMANDDPFILETCPHVLFAGNQTSFGTRLVRGAKGQQVRLVTVPSFVETATIVLVDLKDLSCFPITIEP